MRRQIAGAAFLLIAAATAASAQPYVGKPRPRAGIVEGGAGAVWIRGYGAGDASALETANTTTGTPPITLFATSSSVRSAAGGEGRLGVYVTRRVLVEGFFQYSRPSLETRVSQDYENAQAVTADVPVASYLAGGTALYHFGDGQLVPFVGGGAAYVRQLYDGNSVMVTGSEFHALGGVKYWFGGRVRHFGLRVDAGVSSRSKSVGFEDKRRVLPTLSGGITYLFGK